MNEREAPTLREGAPRTEPPAAQLRIGTTLAGRFVIVGVLGEGGWGVVYRARDQTLELDVALKVLHPRIASDRAKLAFFRNEVRIARKVTHPNVCRLHDLVEVADTCFITMEYVAGESLLARLQRGRLAPDRARRVLRDVTAGLAASHAAGVIHRDLKPSNVLVAGDRAVVADFGIAGEDRVLAAGPQRVVGTRGYMAPEQATGAPIDARADVYALGVLAFLVLTGVRPPQVPTLSMSSHAPPPVLLLDELAPHLRDQPPALTALLLACLAADPAHRPADAGAVLARLDELSLPNPGAPASAGTIAAAELDSPTSAVRGEAAPAITVRAPRRRFVVASLAVAGLAAAATTASLWWFAPAPAAQLAAPPAPPHLVLPALDASGLAAQDRWLAPVVQRLIARELDDAWGVHLDLQTAMPPPADAIVIPARLSRGPGGQFRLAFEHAVREAATARELAVSVAARIVADHVPIAARHPTAAELANVGTRDPEAWRLWRRGQREAMLGRWVHAGELCQQALARDPAFPVAALERQLTFSVINHERQRDFDKVEDMMRRVPVGPLWHLALAGARQLAAGDMAGATRTAFEVFALDLSPREQLMVQLRWLMALYLLHVAPATLTPMTIKLIEAFPDDPTAYKLLTMIYLGSDAPRAAELALRYAQRAAELAPDDAAARAELAVALGLAGRADDARAQARQAAELDPSDQQFARGVLFDMHMMLGDTASAEIDAERSMAGTTGENDAGAFELAMLDLFSGRFTSGLGALIASADALDARGGHDAAARRRYDIARQAAQLGDRATATALLGRIGAASPAMVGKARVLALLVAGKLADARAATAALPDATPERADAELLVADAAHDDAGVLAASARLEQLASPVDLYATGEALIRGGRPDDAVAAFERMVHHPFAWTEPVATVRAWRELGRLRERAGDLDGARAAYAEVIAHWGNATTHMPEVDAARAALRARKAR